MPKLVDDAKMDSIILLREKGCSYEQIQTILNTADATIGRVVKANEAARNRDFATLRDVCYARKHLLEWACKRYGIKESEMEPKQETKQEPEKNPVPDKPDNTAMAFAALLESIKELTAAVNAIDKRLSAMQLTQQGFRGDMADRIGKVIEAVNVNGDILTKEHDRMIDLLGGIKQNTKRRYQNQEG